MKILSLFDYSGHWPQPFKDNGWDVVLVDIKHGIDILTWDYKGIGPVDAILAAPVCTDFSTSGAQYWKKKDADGRTAYSVSLVERTLEIVDYFRSRNDLRFWAMENPVGRLSRMLRGDIREGEPSITVPQNLQAVVQYPHLGFQPCDYGGWLSPTGDAYNKKTFLWGEFNNRLTVRRVEPEFVMSGGKKYSKVHMATGGSLEKTKELRSMTPMGFAKAFYHANGGKSD